MIVVNEMKLMQAAEPSLNTQYTYLHIKLINENKSDEEKKLYI